MSRKEEQRKQREKMIEENGLIYLDKVSKIYTAGAPALNGVTLHINRGEFVFVVGDSGSGKSTLIKVLAGIYQPNKGEIILDGKPCRFNSPIEARRAGISVVHQEIKLAEPLSVAENMFLGNVQLKNGLVDWKGMRRRAREIVEDLGMDIDINAQVSSLTVAKKQIVEIMHAINNNSRILIMDEPTRGIDVGAKYEIYQIMIDLVKQGKSIIMISSEMPELIGMSNRIIVMCNGHITGEVEGEDATQEKIMSFATKFTLSGKENK